jgi:alpha-N-arabinofuranosidase
MNRSIAPSWIRSGLLAALILLSPRFARANVVVDAQPLHAGRISPMLFGNFMELLDDVVPGMWAEMLNDRSFAGIIPPVNWCYFDGSLDICDRPWDTNATWSYDTDKPFNGPRSAKLAAGPQPASLTQSGLAVENGKTYDFSGYFRAEGNVRASVVLKCLLPTGEWITLASAELPAPSAQWQKFSVQMPSKGATDRAVFELRADGSGTLWAGKLSLMPADNQNGWRRDVVEAIKAIRPSIVRWGGSSVDPGRYLWKQGIGDRDLRTPWHNMNWGRFDPNDVGLDEFCQFCALIGAEPLICVSFGDGAQSAADLVQYCNGDAGSTWGAQRAANGHAAPYQVKYWQIGNEISGDNKNYLRQIPDFIALMRKTDPQALLMTSFPSQHLFDTVGSNIDFVCPHHYTTDLGECDRDFNNCSQMIDHTPGCSNIKMAVTEWNIDAGSWGLGRIRQITLGAALKNARYLNLLIRHSDKVKIACRSNMDNAYFAGIIETCPSGVLKPAAYYVMDLYSHHTKPIPLRLERSDEKLDVVAAGSEDGKSVVVFAVNGSAEPADLTLEFAGFAKAVHIRTVEAVRDVLQAGQPDVMNHWNTPERIKTEPIPASGDSVVLPGFSVAAIECEAD